MNDLAQVLIPDCGDIFADYIAKLSNNFELPFERFLTENIQEDDEILGMQCEEMEDLWKDDSRLEVSM